MIWAMFNDPRIMEMSGQTVISAEMGVKYGITDTSGKYPPSAHQLHKCAQRVHYPYKIKQNGRENP